MSNRTKAALQDRLRVALFGEAGLQHPGLPAQPTQQVKLRQQAARLRDLAERGMRPRAGRKEADALDAQAAALDATGETT